LTRYGWQYNPFATRGRALEEDPGRSTRGAIEAGRVYRADVAVDAQCKALRSSLRHISNLDNSSNVAADAAEIGEDLLPTRIYDVKWKKLEAAPNSGVGRDDIYQMASYATRYDCRHVTLLYPTVDEVTAGLVETFILSDAPASRVDVFALDLHSIVRGAALAAGLGPAARE
jgi:hypothetical protein